MNSKQLENWADQLLLEYEEGRKDLKQMHSNLDDNLLPDKQDKTHVNSMIDSMTYSIDWMKTGRQPDVYKGVDKRDKYRIKLYDDMDVIPDIVEQIEREPLYMSDEQRQSLKRLIINLSDRERQCYIMHEAERLSFSQIARRLGVTKAAVQSYINRARKKVEEIAS